MSYHKRYIEEFHRLKCAPDVMMLNVFPNAKEITETMAMYNAVKFGLGLNTHNPGVAVVCVGDGQKPRTATMFAFLTKWTAYSIDPDLKVYELPVDRLHIIPEKVEETELMLTQFHTVVIAMVHSHAPMRETLKALPHPNRHVVTIPCCVHHDIPNKEYIGYTDTSIWSPKNTVKIWRDA